MYKVGQAAMIVSGAALVALAARQRSWTTVGAALVGAPLIYRGATGHWPAAPQALTGKAADAIATAPIESAVTISKPAAELYAFWRRFENLPQFMRHLESVVDLGDGRSHWVGKGPLGFKAEWDAEIVEERDGQLISWRSLPGSQVHNAGTVMFEDSPNGRGTIVRVSMELGAANPITQAVGKALSSFTEQQVREDLRRFKHLMETGELPTIDGQPAGARPFINIRNPL